MHAPQVTPGHGEVTRASGAAGQHHGVELASQRGRGNNGRVRRSGTRDLWRAQQGRPPDDDPRAELSALFRHLGEPAVEHRLLELELGDAVAQQPTDALGTLEDDDLVPGPGELLGGGKPGRTRADDRHLLAGPGAHPVGREHPGAGRPLGGLELDLLDQHWLGHDPEHAGAFAWRRAEPAGELGEVVRRVQAVARFGEATALDEVVPLRDQVAQGATLVAERDAAAHAPGRLLGELLTPEGKIDLPPVPDPGLDRAAPRTGALVTQESPRISHVQPP